MVLRYCALSRVCQFGWGGRLLHPADYWVPELSRAEVGVANGSGRLINADVACSNNATLPL
jgi:hypothetical protein